MSVIGTGYLGVVHAACMADLGHTVIAIDNDAAKVEATPDATPYPSVNPAPIDPPSPSPYYRSCGGCGPWQGPGPRPLIMCPLACVNGSE